MLLRTESLAHFCSEIVVSVGTQKFGFHDPYVIVNTELVCGCISSDGLVVSLIVHNKKLSQFQTRGDRSFGCALLHLDSVSILFLSVKAQLN